MANNVHKAKKGYMFNQESGKLESYELIGVKFRDNHDECEYTFKLGGVEKTIVSTKMEIYADEDCFKRHEIMPPGNLDVWEISTCIAGYRRGCIYRFHNGQAEKVSAEDIELYYDAQTESVSVVDGTKYYESKEECYLWNDIVVVEEDGTERIVEALGKKVQLTDEQKKLVEQLNDNFKALHELGVRFAYDVDYGKLKCLNTNNIHYEGVSYCNDYDNEEFTDLTKCATTLELYISYLGCDDLLIGKKKSSNQE